MGDEGGGEGGRKWRCDGDSPPRVLEGQDWGERGEHVCWCV